MPAAADPEDERLMRVRLLLNSLYDYLPTPGHRSALTQAGFSTGSQHLLHCPDCDFNGFVHSSCETCGGRGFVENGTVDPYDTGRDFAWMNLEDGKKRAARRRDEILLQLRRDELAREGKLDLRERYGWENKRMLMERHGDYRQLRHGLRRLQHLCPVLYDTLHQLYFSGEYDDPPRTPREQVAVEFLSRQIKGPVRVPPWLQNACTAPTFTDLVARGLSSRQIAFRLGLSQKKVKRMLKGLVHVRAA